MVMAAHPPVHSDRRRCHALLVFYVDRVVHCDPLTHPVGGQANVGSIGSCDTCAAIRTRGVGLMVEGDRETGA